MPTSWPAELYDYTAWKVVHKDILGLDLQEGKWFKCKFCKNRKTKNVAGYFEREFTLIEYSFTYACFFPILPLRCLAGKFVY